MAPGAVADEPKKKVEPTTRTLEPGYAHLVGQRPHKEVHMKFVGVDLHKKSLTICAMDPEGRVVKRARLECGETEAILELLRGLGEFEIVVEASGSYEWFARLVEPLAKRFVLCHPKKMRIIAESTRKSDKLDATVLAEFLRHGMIPEAYRPLPRQKGQQVLVRQRQHVVRGASRVKARIRSLLGRYNADKPGLFRKDHRDYVKGVALSATDRFVRDQLLMEFDFCQEQLDAADEQLKKYAAEAGKGEAESRRLLGTVPGVGVVTTDAWLGEVGDVGRFRSAKRVVAYVGLAPGFRSSDDKTRELGITKEGSRLMRCVLIQSAWAAVRTSVQWKGWFERIAKRRGRKKAIVAVARRLAVVMYAVAKAGRPYDPLKALPGVKAAELAVA